MTNIVRFATTHLKPYPVQVVGESHYRHNFVRLFPKLTPDGIHQDKLLAHLILDDKSPYDPNAVKVEIKGYQVGHLSSENALRYRKALSGLGLSTVTGECVASVVGGFQQRDGDTADFGVRLDINLENLVVEMSSEQPVVEGRIAPVTPTPKKIRWLSGRNLGLIVMVLIFTCVCLSCLASANN